MLTDLKQNELDLAESRLLQAIFGSDTIDSRTEWLLKFMNVDLNKIIQDLESKIKPLMDERGFVHLPSEHIPPFRLVDCVDFAVSFIGGNNGRD